MACIISKAKGLDADGLSISATYITSANPSDEQRHPPENYFTVKSNTAANTFMSDLNGNLGALEIGSVLGASLFGVETLQTFNYYKNFPQDSNLLKSTVSLVWLDRSALYVDI
ncbi:hypothetical protein B0H11DRAFT_2249623 [Mycena galericulata]|nr:hypothetical protein B0H11DRAFT_2249623 [Mycena galericulata]